MPTFYTSFASLEEYIIGVFLLLVDKRRYNVLISKLKIIGKKRLKHTKKRRFLFYTLYYFL